MTEVSEETFDGLSIWNQVDTTNPDETKEVAYGARTFTAIDAYTQIKRATELWGPYGGEWKLGHMNYEVLDDFIQYHKDGPKKVKLILITGIFEFPEGKFPVINDMILRPGEETTKKILTNTLTKALSYLGFNADVFTGQFEGTATQVAPDELKAVLKALLKDPLVKESEVLAVTKMQDTSGWLRASVESTIETLQKRIIKRKAKIEAENSEDSS